MQTNNKLFVRNLSFDTTEGELSDVFSTHGNVISAKVATDRDTGRPRGFAFVEMGTKEAAEGAIRSLDQTQFNGRLMHVAMSEPRERKLSTAYGN